LSLKNPRPPTSAPRIRVKQIFNALSELCEVSVICGDGNERQDAISAFHQQHSLSDFDGLYMESMNWPLRGFDYKFLAKASKHMPTSIFYRDCHYRFPKLYSRPSVKWWIALIRSRLQFVYLRSLFNHFFVPTNSFAKLLKVNSFSLLPPAGIVQKVKKSPHSDLNVLFAGGMKSGTHLLVDIIKQMEPTSRNIHFHIFSHDFKHLTGSNITRYEKHLSEHPDILAQMDVALNIIPSNKYMETTFPFKVMDYISFGLPIISVDSFESKKIVEANRIGFVLPYDTDLWCQKLTDLSQNRTELDEISSQAIRLVKETENWHERATTILNKLRELQ